MKNEQRESFRRWAILIVAIAAIFPAYLMGPIAFTFRATVRDLMREELAGYETVEASNARWEAHQKHIGEIFKRLEDNLMAMRGKAVGDETSQHKLLMELADRLSRLESEIKRLTTESQSGADKRE
jgi:hypothetical protein